MSDHAITHEDEGHAHVHPPYTKVFAILATLTLVELFIPDLLGKTPWISISLLVIIAIWKMKLIMGCFMHLAYDARVLLAIAVTPALLASFLVLAFLMEYT